MKNFLSNKRLRDEFKTAATFDCESIYGAALVALHREWGWGQKRADALLEGILEAWNQCASDIKLSALLMLENETGIELKPTPTSRSFHDIPCLNGQTMIGKKLTPGQYLYYRKQVIAWTPYQLMAILFLTLYRQHGFSAVRLTRLKDQIEEYKAIGPEKLKELVQEELGIDLQHYTEGVE